MERTSRFFWSGVSSRSLRWQHGWACCTNATTVAAPPSYTREARPSNTDHGNNYVDAQWYPSTGF